jgi:hypothetical protein
VLALDPELVFTGDVAGVGSLLEHVDDYYFYFYGLLLRVGAGGDCEQEKAENSAHE